MIHQALHKNPVALDRNQHRLLRLRRNHADSSHLAALNSFFVAAFEFGEACREYPVVWIPAGTDAAGHKQVAPVAVFGLRARQNLYLEPSGWRTPYLPAMLRVYPFAMARAAEDQLVMCYDASWGGFSVTDGEALFESDGTPTAFTADTQRQLEQLEAEVERTRLLGEQLLQKNLLQDMRFDATLPDGEKLSVDGFLAVDDKQFRELPDADVLEFHRSGLLGLIHAHQLSLGHMRQLVEWHGQRSKAAARTGP
jgi:SapC